jgi:hypothetical protein
VEIRRNCGDEYDPPWSPNSIYSSSEALVRGGLLSPVLQLSRMSLCDLGSLSGGLDSSIGLADVDFQNQKVLSGTNIVAETPANASRIPKSLYSGKAFMDEGASRSRKQKGSAVSQNESITLFESEICEESEHVAVIPETPLKNDQCYCAEEPASLCVQPQPKNSETEENDIAFSEAAQAKTETLLKECADNQFDECSEINLKQNGSVVCDRVKSCSSLCAVLDAEKPTQDSGSKQCNSPINTFPTLHSALTFYSDHFQQVMRPCRAVTAFSLQTLNRSLNFHTRARFMFGPKSFPPLAPESFWWQPVKLFQSINQNANCRMAADVATCASPHGC